MDSKDNAQPIESGDKLVDMLKDIKVAMMTTIDRKGHLRSRPMVTVDRAYDGTIWFFTPTNTAKVDEIEHDERVNLSYAKPESNSFVSISGTARLVRDDNMKRSLWKQEYLSWAPNGPEDTNLGLLQVMVDEAEYWDAPSGTMVFLKGIAKALTGQPPTAEVADNVKVNYT